MSNVALGCWDTMHSAYQRLKTSQHVLYSTELVVSCMPGQRLQSFKVCALCAQFPLSCDSRLSKPVVCSWARSLCARVCSYCTPFTFCVFPATLLLTDIAHLDVVDIAQYLP